jgi:diacylglycerol O-acyltransferase
MATKRSGESMSKVDTAWLRMDSASNLMAILGVWTLKPRVPYEDVCRRMEERLLAYGRFRQRVEEDATGARWVDHDVDIHEHVVREKLEPHRHANAQEALQHRIGELAMEPLDRSRPLWKMHLVEDYDGGSALIVRIHHCIADGVALILVTLGLVDGGGLPPHRKRRERPDGIEEWLSQRLVQPLAGLAVKALDAAGGNAAKLLATVLQPKKGARASVEVAHLGYQLVSDALALLLMPDDTPTRLKGKPGTRKRVAWCPPLPLDEV